MSMDPDKFEIVICDKDRGYSTGLQVQKLADNRFKMLENDPFTANWNLGTEFEATLNTEGQYEIVSITRQSDFLTRRFFLSTRYNQTDYEFIGTELVKIGGFWQYDMGIVTINIPQDKKDEANKVIEDLGLYSLELTDD